MNAKILLPLLLVSTTVTADIVPDRRAMEACQNRYDVVNHSQDLNLRRGPVYTTRKPVNGTYQYYFNARNTEKSYRVECRARRIGKVVEFVLEPGKWVFNRAVNEEVAAN